MYCHCPGHCILGVSASRNISAVDSQTHLINTLFCTYIDSYEDGWDGAGQTNPPAKEEHTQTGTNGEAKAMVPSSVVILLVLEHMKVRN